MNVKSDVRGKYYKKVFTPSLFQFLLIISIY
nr:MAG TPA: hypothetical protein [Caudoviricetes sp.]